MEGTFEEILVTMPNGQCFYASGTFSLAYEVEDDYHCRAAAVPYIDQTQVEILLDDPEDDLRPVIRLSLPVQHPVVEQIEKACGDEWFDLANDYWNDPGDDDRDED